MSNPSLPLDDEYSESLDAEIIRLDGPGDTTIRPCRPERLEFLKALRARYVQAEAAKSAQAPGNGQKS
jgi:hypothetical protein